jgi:hypothetical protein
LITLMIDVRRLSEPKLVRRPDVDQKDHCGSTFRPSSCLPNTPDQERGHAPAGRQD